MNKKTFGVIGLAKRAGRLAQGAESVVESIRSGKAKLALIACDASANTKKTVTDKAAFYSVDCLVTDADMASLGGSIGGKSTAAVAFTDENFVKAFEKSLSAEDPADTEREV